tara:strand:+ start:1219 stop:1725 length:507 start_codon:yes stop_codon:yes gene_type:complete
MDNNLKSKEEVQRMMALSEEVNALNLKVKQLVEDLSSTQDVLGSVQELTSQLTSKVGELNDASNNYTQPNMELNDKMGTPSYQTSGDKRERIIPTPENIGEYNPEPVQPVAQPVSAPVVDDSKPKHQVGTKITQKQELRRATKQSRKNRQSQKKSTGWGFGGKAKGNG